MNDDLDKELFTILEEYSKNLPNEIIEIEKTWSKLHEKWNCENLLKFQAGVHKLSGCAGTYGYTDLSDTALNLENLLRSFSEMHSPDSKEKKQLTELVKDLRKFSSSSYRKLKS